MAMRVEVNPDGTLHFISDGPIVFTGPIKGEVTLPTGEVVNVAPQFVEARDDAEALAIAEAIGQRHQDEGHPSFLNDPSVPDDGFVFTPKG